jgi:hypothetical protein
VKEASARWPHTVERTFIATAERVKECNPLGRGNNEVMRLRQINRRLAIEELRNGFIVRVVRACIVLEMVSIQIGIGR